MYEQYHLRSSINIATHKIKPGTLTARTVKNNFKGTLERFVASDSAFSFISFSKEHQHTGNSFYIMHMLWLSS